MAGFAYLSSLRRFSAGTLPAISVWLILGGLAGGCITEREAQPNPRDGATADPMNYNPAGKQPYGVSGGGVLEFDRDALRKDLDHVFSP